MITISRNAISGVADGFGSRDATWLAIYAAFSFGGGFPLQSDQLRAEIQIPDWGGEILDYMYSSRDSAAEAVAIQALNEAVAVRQLGIGGRQDVDAFLYRLKLDGLARAYGYSRRGGIGIQDMADLLPPNLQIGLESNGAGGLMVNAATLERVKALSAEATLAEGETSSLTENEKTMTSTEAVTDWLSTNALYVGIGVIAVLALVYYKWVR